MLPPLSRFNLARTCQNNFRCTRPPLKDQCQLLGKVRIRVKETRESLVRLEIARSAQIHALGPRDGENRIASDGRNFHVFAVLHAIVLSTIVISTAMAWPLRKRIYSRNNDIRNRKNIMTAILFVSLKFCAARCKGRVSRDQSIPTKTNLVTSSGRKSRFAV